MKLQVTYQVDIPSGISLSDTEDILKENHKFRGHKVISIKEVTCKK